MGGATNPNGQANATITINNFVGNLKANLPGNSAENNAGVAYSAGVSTLYGSLSVASQEVKVFAPLNVVGMVVHATIDSAKAIGGLIKGNYSAAIVSGCSAVGGVVGGVVGGAIGTAITAGIPGPSTVLGGILGAAAGAPLAAASCQTALGYINGEASSTSQQGTQAKALVNTVTSPILSQVSATVTASPQQTDTASLASQIVQFRPSPDYSGTAGAYTVQRGQTLSGIAVANGISLAQLQAANPQIVDVNSIRTGQAIQLPPNASGYVPGNGPGQNSSDSVPNDAAQTSSLTNVLEQFSGQNVSIVAENSGRIAVVSSTSETTTLIANDGTVSTETLASYTQQVQVTYDNYVANGSVDLNTQVCYADYQDGIYGSLNANGQGTILTSAGLLYQDASGNIAAQASNGSLYAFDASTGKNLFANINTPSDGSAVTFAAVIQAQDASGTKIADLKTYDSNGLVFSESITKITQDNAVTSTDIQGDRNGIYTEVDRSFDTQGNLTSTATTSRATLGGELTTTVDSKVGDNDVSVTYSYDANKTPVVQSLNSINGQTVDVATSDAFVLQANSQNTNASTQDPVTLTQSLSQAILPTLNVNVNNVDTAVSTTVSTTGTVDTVTLTDGSNVNLTSGNQYVSTTTAPPADSSIAIDVPAPSTPVTGNTTPSTSIINGVTVTDNGDGTYAYSLPTAAGGSETVSDIGNGAAVVTTLNQDGHTKRNKNRSCLRTCLLGCGTKRYLKTGKECIKKLKFSLHFAAGRG